MPKAGAVPTLAPIRQKPITTQGFAVQFTPSSSFLIH